MMQQKSPLFLKPNENLNAVFEIDWKDIHSKIIFRSLRLSEDLQTIHNWVNLPYANEYWQMTGPFSQLFAMYQCMELNPYSHSYIGLLKQHDEEEKMICQFDVYTIMADELRQHIDAGPHDCGFHLLMAPHQKPIPGLTVRMVQSFLSYYFSFPEAERMYAEPDIENTKSIALLERCGFVFVGQATLSYKVARVYCLDRAQFLLHQKEYPSSSFIPYNKIPKMI